MPPLALANAFWLGREHPLYQGISLATSLALGRGRLCMRKLFLGHGPRDEVHSGLTGNIILLAQPDATSAIKLPDLDHTMETIQAVFCRSVDDVENAHVLMMQRDQYLQCAELRKKVCKVFEDIPIDHAIAAATIPENGVPSIIVERAIGLPEA